MTRIVLLLLVAACLLISTGCDHPRPAAEPWTTWVSDGKSDDIVTDDLPLRDLPSGYFDALKRLTYWNVVDEADDPGTPEQRAPYAPSHITISDIGQWGPYEVFDVTSVTAQHKGIVLRDHAGDYRILYAQFLFSTAGVEDLPTIADIQGNQVLIYRTRIPGTGSQFIELYAVIDEVSGKPRLVDLSPMHAAIQQALPPGYGVWKGGGLDFAAMTFCDAVWKPGDANCCPTGGRIDLRLTLTKGILHVTDTTYQPDYAWQ